MNFCNWCQHAQEDQIEQGKGIVYGNIQHSHQNDLIYPWGYQAADAAFGEFTDAVSTLDTTHADFGVAAFLIRYAVHRQDQNLLAIGHDFRLSGREIKADRDRFLVSCGIRSEDAPTRSSASAKGRPPIKAVKTKVSAAPDIRWLSLPEKVIEFLGREAGEGVLSQPEIVSLLVAGLGLRLNYRSDQDIVFTIRGYRLRANSSLRRPNALSDGYPEKFCEVSPYYPFGATADNRTGEAALPEAVAFLGELKQVDQTDTDFKSFCAQLECLGAPPVMASGAIEGRFPATDYTDRSNPAASRNELMQRLRNSVGAACENYCKFIDPEFRSCEKRLGQICQ